MIAAIPFRTFPDFHLGPIPIHTFGVVVGAGILAGALVAGAYAGRVGLDRERVFGLAGLLVVAGLVGARVAWVVTHIGDIHSPVDIVAVWNGGLEFTGGFLAAVVVAMFAFRRSSPLERWRMADGLAFGLTVGVAIGRIGCISVGEHLGNPTSFVLGWRYLGGPTREGPLTVGVIYQSTAIDEVLQLAVLAVVLWWLLFRRTETIPGTAVGVFCLWYGLARFGTDFLRAYDGRALGLTGAQWACAVLLVPAGAWILATGRQRAERLGVDGRDRAERAHGVAAAPA